MYLRFHVLLRLLEIYVQTFLLLGTSATGQHLHLRADGHYVPTLHTLESPALQSLQTDRNFEESSSLRKLQIVSPAVKHQRIRPTARDSILVGALLELDVNDQWNQDIARAVRMAIDDLNRNATILFQGRHLELLEIHPKTDPFQVSVWALSLLQTRTVSLIGPVFSSSAKIVSSLTAACDIPVLSFAASDPGLSDEATHPFFLRTVPSDVLQMQGLAQLIRYFNWSKIVVVHTNEDFGIGGARALGMFLLGTKSRIVLSVPIPPSASEDRIHTQLREVRNQTESTVFVLHVLPEVVNNLVSAVKKAEMQGPGFAWLSTDSAFLQMRMVTNKSTEPLLQLEGLLCMFAVVPSSPKLADFQRRWNQGAKEGQPVPDTYTLRAYDAVCLLGEGIAKGLRAGKLTLANLTQGTGWGEEYVLRRNRALTPQQQPLPRNALSRGVIRSSGRALRNLILEVGQSGTFHGLSGRVQLDAQGDSVNVAYDIINVVKEGSSKSIGSWSTRTGLELTPSDKVGESLVSPVVWPGGVRQVPLGWLADRGRSLLVAVPTETFSEIVSFDPNRTGNSAFSGFSIDVFEEAVRLLPFNLNYTYIASNASYNDIITQIAQGVYDLAVGDFSITDLRSKEVDFSQPFKSAGLVLVAPRRRDRNLSWAFLEPFTLQMWAAIGGLYFLLALAILWLERARTGPFGGKTQEALGRSLWWSYSTFFFAQAGIVSTPLGRCLAGAWLFVVLIIVSSYQANLTSATTVDQLSPVIKSIASIIQSTKFSVGVAANSWYGEALRVLNIQELQIKSIENAGPDAYIRFMKGAGKPWGVDAIVDELPYAQLFVADNCNFEVRGQEFLKGGWGIPVREGSHLQEALSTAILQMSKKGTVREIEVKWLKVRRQCKVEDYDLLNNRLQAMGHLLLILVCTAAVGCILVYAKRTYMRNCAKGKSLSTNGQPLDHET